MEEKQEGGKIGLKALRSKFLLFLTCKRFGGAFWWQPQAFYHGNNIMITDTTVQDSKLAHRRCCICNNMINNSLCSGCSTCWAVNQLNSMKFSE